ncbi:MAG: FecR domain-containing protein [Burkholderiales bacterium]|nr:FecR domain-containing protein [Burkholderiales bacterium]
MIPATIVNSAARAFGVFCVLFAFGASSSAAGAQIGYVHEVSGLVSIKQVAARPVAAKVGDIFEADTVLRTGPDAKVTLKLADGEVVALGKNSALRVGRYSYVPGSPRQSSSTLELIKGEARIVTGAIGSANREGVRIIAGNSVLSVLSPVGADFTVAVDPGAEEVGHTIVARGEISVATPYGEISKVAAGQYAPWQPGRTLQLPIPLAAAPAVVQADAAAFWTAVLPDNKPIAVASAAQAAGALAAANLRADANAASRLAGYVVEATSNTVSIRGASGDTLTAKPGTTFEAGTTISTGADGRIAVKFADGQLAIVGPGSVLSIGQYQFDPKDAKAGRLAVELLNGAMRIVTGEIHQQNIEGMSISAGASIIDVLNSVGPADFTVVVDTKNQEVGVARVTVGEISVHTPYGPIEKIGANESSLWGPGKTPTSPAPLATSLAVVQAAVALQLSGLPANTPVNVASAAAATAAATAADSALAAANADPQNAQLQAEADAATELAELADEAAADADAALVAESVASTLETLPPAAAGVELAQAPAQPARPIAQIVPPVTPGAGGRCTGSVC